MDTKKKWTIEFLENGKISIDNWQDLARAFGIPKSSKRIEKKRLKKRLTVVLETYLNDNLD